MVIDRNKGFIFVHVPKTGGQSIINALGLAHETPRASHEPFHGIDKQLRKLFWSFGVVRNPLERLVSLYHFMCQKNMKDSDNFNQRAINEMGFKHWLMNDEFYMFEDKRFMNGGTSLLPPMQRRAQSWWLNGCDSVIHFDDLENNLNEAFSKAGLGRVALPHINKSDHDDWGLYYDQEMVDFVLKYHGTDFDQYGFAK